MDPAPAGAGDDADGTPPPEPALGMDDSQFLGSIIGLPAAQPPAPAPPKRKRGRPPKRAGAVVAAAAPPRPPRKREDEEEVVCFICFDGGNLVVCDRRGCPKVYHPACIKRDEAFFQSRSKWNCGWHICSSCEKAVHYMCYTCTYSLCKVCIKQGKFFSVRGTKGFCDTCFGTILLIESKDESATKVDFDDVLSWEYLFKLYWLDLKGKLSLTLEELTSAKNRWNVPNTSARKEKEESSDDLYDVNNDDDAGSDCSSGKRRRTNSSKKKGRKRRKVQPDCSIAAKKAELPIRGAESVPMEVPNERVTLPVDTKVPNGQAPLPADTKVPNERVPLPPDIKWASPELLEFIGHMRDGDQSFISQFDVQTLLLEYIKKNNLRDPQRKSQIICDTRLLRLFRKARVAHFEMLKLLEMHFLTNETPGVNDSSQVMTNLNSAHVDTNGYSDMAAKLSPDKRRRMHRKVEREPQVNLEAYAAVDMHNINLIYVRRSVMEDLIDDATFSDKIRGAFVRIKISGVGQKQDIYRLVKVVGTHRVPEKYCIGKKMTNVALEILNLDKKEIITMDTTSNQDFTEEECKRLRQSMKCGVISRLKVGDIQEKAKILQSVRVNDWFENEKQRLGHLRDRASETGRRKELRECVEKLQLLSNSEERSRRINEVLEVHVDSHMDPAYESAEEMDDKKAVGRSVNWTRSDASIPRRKIKYPNTMHNHPQKVSDYSHHPKSLSTESTIRGLGGGRKFENSTYEAGLLSSPGVTMSNDMEPEKVWHYKDPSGNVQGPFTLLQLSKWTSYFPRDLRVWLTFESEERSLLLTEVLSKQQKDFTQAATLTSSKPTLAGTGHTMNSPSVDHTNALSPVGYSMVSSSGVPVHFNKYSVLERETVHSPDDSLSLSTSSVPPKDAHTVNSHAHCQTKHSVFIQSSGSSYGHTDLHHDRIQGGCSGESNHRHGSGALWSPTMAHTSCSGRGNVESHQNHHVSCSQCQHDSRDSSQGGSVKDLNSRRDLSKNLPTQRAGKDVSSPVFAWSPAESRTASSQHESSCLSSTNPSFLDELHSSIASAKPKSCAPATPIEDRGSSSPSGMLNHSERVPISSPHSAPYTSASDVCKMEEIMNQQRTHEVDTSNASVNQSPQSKIFPVSSPDIQDIGREFPSPTPRSENKDLAVDNLQLTPASPENAMTTYSHSSDTCKIVEIVSQQKTPEVVVSSPSDNHSPQSKVFPASSPNNKDQEHECPSSTPSSENTKVRDVDNLILTSADPENLTTPAPASDLCKMEESMNHHHSPQSKVSPASSPNNKDQKHECPSSTPSSENTKVRDVDNLILTPVDPENLTTPAPASDICKMEESMNHQKTLEADTLDAPLYQPPHSSTPSNHDIDRECASPTPKSESKELLVDNSMTSATPESLMTTSASASDTCKIEEFVNQQKTLEVDASDAPLNQHPDPHIFPDNQDIESECASPTPRSDGKEPLVDNSVLTPAAPENLPTTLAPASDTSKMEILNKERTLQADASLNQPPPSTIDPSSSPYNQDIECGHPCPTPRSESEQPIVDNSGLTSIAPENLTSFSASASDISKMEKTSNEKRTLEAKASDASLNQPPHSSIFPSRDNQDVECAHPSPTPKSEGDQTLADDSGLRSIAPENLTSASASVSDICKMEILNEKRILEADASDASLNQPPNSCIFPSDNQGVECEHPSPSPRSESEQPLADNSGLILIAPENSTSASASASDICKMEEILNEKTTLEANPSNGSDTPSPESKVFLVPSLDVLDIEHELSGTTHRPEVKEPVVDSSGLTSAAPENLTTKEPVCSQDAFVSPKSGLTGELDTMNADFKVEEIIQKELYYESEPTVVTRENMLIDLSCGAESIDVSDVLESLMEQRCGTSYMQGTMEGFLAASPEEEPQCSSPIALSPWGEPSYYQGDAVDSALWGVQDDPIIDMWSLLSPRPTLQSSSGIGTEGNGTYDINVAAVAHGNTEIVQRGSVLWEENVNQTNLSAATDWTLHEQFPSISNDMLISSVDESTRVVGWQPSVNQSLNGVTWSTGQNVNLSSNEKAEPSSKSSWEASRKQEATNSTVVEANGNTSKGLNPPSGNANRGSQRNPHHRGRYSQISESWLLSSNQSRSRSDRFGSGGSSRSTWKGQSRD